MKFIENTADKVIKTLRKSSIFPKIFFIKPADMHTKGNISMNFNTKKQILKHCYTLG